MFDDAQSRAEALASQLNGLYPVVYSASPYRVERRGQMFFVVKDYYSNAGMLYTEIADTFQ